MVNDLQSAFNEIAELRGLPEEVVQEALQSALVSAYRRYSGASSAQAIEARTDPRTRRMRIYVEKEVTDEIFSPETEVTLEQARFYEPEAEIGDMVMVQVDDTAKKFGRIAAQTAKQVILQKIREAERNALYEEFADKEGELMMGTVQSMNSNVVTLRLGERAESILPRAQQIPGERHRAHEKVRVYVMEVKRSNKGPQIIVSRSHRNMLRRLLEYEVPEIYNGQVEIKSIAREAGYRSKVAVAALQEGIDPVGACVGMRGIRIQNIVKELHDEKIDVIEWNPDPETFISKALSPARVSGVFLDDDMYNGRTAVVIVPDDQLSLAIGREGQNARLAAKLTGWRIDIKSVTETVVGALENLDMPPLDTLTRTHGPQIEKMREIVAKRDANKVATPEDLNKMSSFAITVEKRIQAMRDEIRREEQERIDAVRATLPQFLFDIPVAVLGIDEDITEALATFETAGDVMLASLVDEERLQAAIEPLGEDAFDRVQSVLDDLMTSEYEATDFVDEDEEAVSVAEAEELVAEVEEPETVAEAIDIAEEEDNIEEEPVAEVAPVGVIEVEEDDIDSEDDADEDESAEPEAAAPASNKVVVDDDEDVIESYFDDLDFEDDEFSRKVAEPKQGRRERRRLVLDEESGEVVAKRRRKRNNHQDWEEDYDL